MLDICHPYTLYFRERGLVGSVVIFGSQKVSAREKKKGNTVLNCYLNFSFCIEDKVWKLFMISLLLMYLINHF